MAYPIQSEIAWVFGLPGAWTALDPSTVDYVFDTGELVFPMNILGLPYNEVAVTYTAGVSTVGNDVMSACAQIVKNMQATPSLNVKSSRLDTLQMEYFFNSLIDQQVQALLRPYIANRLG